MKQEKTPRDDERIIQINRKSEEQQKPKITRRKLTKEELLKADYNSLKYEERMMQSLLERYPNMTLSQAREALEEIPE